MLDTSRRSGKRTEAMLAEYSGRLLQLADRALARAPPHLGESGEAFPLPDNPNEGFIPMCCHEAQIESWQGESRIPSFYLSSPLATGLGLSLIT